MSFIIQQHDPKSRKVKVWAKLPDKYLKAAKVKQANVFAFASDGREAIVALIKAGHGGPLRVVRECGGEVGCHPRAVHLFTEKQCARIFLEHRVFQAKEGENAVEEQAAEEALREFDRANTAPSKRV